MMLEGVLPVWKPEGMTSHDVVARVRRITREKRIGHTGTLDPQVTGVLPLCIGHATRLVELVQELPKTYIARLMFGVATDTEDWTGTITERAAGKVSILIEDLEQTLSSFEGEIEQVPPMFSAVKIDGKRLYELARSGVAVERRARKVTIYNIRLLEANLSLEQPEVRIEVICSKGTYIRTLCVDIGKALGVPSVMKELTRTQTGCWTREHCLTLEQIERLQSEGRLAEHLVPLDEAMAHLPAVILDERQTGDALQGKKLTLPDIAEKQQFRDSEHIRVYSPGRKFIGLFTWRENERQLVPFKVFLTSFQRA